MVSVVLGAIETMDNDRVLTAVVTVQEEIGSRYPIATGTAPGGIKLMVLCDVVQLKDLSLS